MTRNRVRRARPSLESLERRALLSVGVDTGWEGTSARQLLPYIEQENIFKQHDNTSAGGEVRIIAVLHGL
jgi:hypothetical protein